MEKQTFLAFILISIILMVWLYMNQPAPQPPAEPIKKENVEQTKPQTEEKKLQTNTAAPAEVTDSAFTNKVTQERIITVETAKCIYEFTTRGGQLKKIFLKDFKTWYHNDLEENAPYYKTQVQLINTSAKENLDLVFVTQKGSIVKTSDLIFNSDAPGKIKITGKDETTLSFVFNAGSDNAIRKSYTLKADDYYINAAIELDNMSDIISGQTYDLNWNSGINFVEKDVVGEANYSEAGIYSGGEYLSVNASDEIIKKNYSGKVDWLSIKNKYFAIVLAPEKLYPEGSAFLEAKTVQQNSRIPESYAIGFSVPLKDSAVQIDKFTFYAGPIDYDILKSGSRNFETLYDFGSFFGLKFLIRPISEYFLLPVLKFLHNFVPNYGVVIIIFSLIIKIITHPLTAKSMHSMRKMQLLQPIINEIKEKYKDDPAKQQSETMGLYSKYGINPAGGCLPMLLQMPIMIALWSLLNVAIEIRQQPFILWIDNLSSPDILLRLPAGFPLLGHLSGLALLMSITMFIQQKMTIKDPAQKAMIYMMPVMFFIMFNSLASGLNLYYFMFNLFSIAHQFYYTHTRGDEKLVPVDKPKEGFMHRMMKAAEEQQKIQQNAGKKKK